VIKPDRLSTTVSTKGQVILPKAVREQLNWGPGARLEVETLADGVILRRAVLFPPTRPEAVCGRLKAAGAARSIEAMDAAVADEAKRHAGD